ncbi:hypothetical protein FH972_009497 [Carpinus fangiana]|uniref:Mitochondrial import receptor subunit TOM20 n=1 Tax=Carpinus fangiana TaxID=176857 RepID=A0A660KM38_9ROSI|nr:hypothetical protein FH972_009497 [Carpinus fangiana]
MSYTTPSSGPSVATIVTATVGVITTSALAYAIYFDHKRRNDPDFRKSLKREGRRQAKAAKIEQEQQGKEERQRLRDLVDEAFEEGVPDTAEEKEQVFMLEVGEGEKLCNDPTKVKEAALCFFRALKVYPNPQELMTIYDKTVPKPVLDAIAEMIAYDRTINSTSSGSSNAGVE